MDRDVAFRGRRGATRVLVAVVAAGLLTLPGSVSPAPGSAVPATPFVEVMAHKKPVRQHPRKPAAKKPKSASKKYVFHRGMTTPEDLWHLYAEPYATQKRLKAPTAHSPLVAVVESGSYGGRVYRDLARYRSHFGLPPCRPGSCFLEINQSGRRSPLPAPDAATMDATVRPMTVTADSAWWNEADLDAEAVSAVCPDCRIMIADASPAEGNDGLVAAAQAAVDQGARYVVMSFGWGDPPVTPAELALFSTPGVVFTAATGDNGYGGPTQPADLAGVLSVGGLTATPSANRRSLLLSAWNGSGSGCSTSAVAAAVQLLLSALSGTCGGAKAETDLSSIASPNSGLLGVLAGTWAIGAGTSLAAPLVAGLYAAAGNHTDPWVIYKRPAQFRDITTGRTGTCRVRLLCTAARGWDAPTGLGTPRSLSALRAP